jgi:hypothetical protein
MDTKIVVIDVPASVPAEEAAALLSEPLTRGYYLKSTTVGEPLRAVFAQYTNDSGKCAEELAAMDLVVANRKATATRIVQLLCKQGIHRTTTWVSKTLADLT